MPDDYASQPAAGTESRARFSMSRIIFAIVGLVLASAAILFTMGPSLSPPGTLVLDKAYVHGAVTRIGIAQDGRIADLEVDLGDAVEAGDIVATLESESIAARLEAADARVARLEAELDSERIDGRETQDAAEAELEQAEAGIEAAEARRSAAAAALELAEEELARSERLAERDVIPQADLAAAREEAQRARAALKRRLAELEVAEAARAEAEAAADREALRAAERAVIEERIAEARAARTRLAAELDRTRIDTKDAGVVVEVASRPGSSVRPNDTIMTIWDTNRIWMSAWVPEDQVARIELGDPARIELDALEGTVFDGIVRRILVAEDGEERTLPGEPISPLLPDETRFAVQVSFEPNEDEVSKLLPGMSGLVQIGERSETFSEAGKLELLMSLL